MVNQKLDRVEWVGEMTRGVYDGFEAFNVRAKGVTTKATGTVIERAHLERPGFSADGSGTAGNRNVKVEPLPGSLLTWMAPLWARMIPSTARS